LPQILRQLKEENARRFLRARTDKFSNAANAETMSQGARQGRTLGFLQDALKGENMPFYSEKVMEHFANPRNVGEIKDADGVGEVGNPVCGDMMTFYIKVKNNIVSDVKFKTFGCGAAIAVSSMVSEMAMGKTVEEVMKITNADVAKELGGLPPNKMHCSNLGADALHKAVKDYRQKQGVK
jgi:nitrogen fixation NifU-like protein